MTATNVNPMPTSLCLAIGTLFWLSAAVLSAPAARADQCVYFDERTASLVQSKIKTGDVLLNYCKPCNMPEPLPLRITAMQIEQEETASAPKSMDVHGYRYTYDEIKYGRVPGLREDEQKRLLAVMETENHTAYKLIINNELQDLAYLYFATGPDTYTNIGVTAGCAEGVTQSLTYKFPDKSEATAKPDNPLFEDITGQCFDGSCLLNEWKISKRATLLGDHSPDAGPVMTVGPGDSVKVEKIISEVQPLRAVVVFDQGHFVKGDEFYVLNSLGEGYFRVWYYGQIVEEELLGVSMQQMENGEWAKCPEADANCWAEANGHPEEIWWALVTTRDGKQGWLREPASFVENIFAPE